MKPTDQTAKLHCVLIAAALGLVGFLLEVGPVGGVFSLTASGLPIFTGLTLELLTLGFLAYLALAASTAVGLHLSEEEPTPKEGPREPTEATAGAGPAVGERVAVRPELHQMRMYFTALGGYAILKGMNVLLLSRYGLTTGQLTRLFEFGFIFTALGWFVLWQFLRWYAQRRRWVRLQAELIGGDVTQLVAVAVLVKPLVFFFTTARNGLAPGLLTVLAVLLHLSIVATALLLWSARPLTLRRTLISLGVVGVAVLFLTLALAIAERLLATV